MKSTKSSSGDTSSIHYYMRPFVGLNQEWQTSTIKRIKGQLPKVIIKTKVL